MMPLRSARLLFALIASASPAAAQDRRLRSDVEDAVDDFLFVWSSPFHASASDLEGLALVAGMVGGAMLFDGRVQHWLDTHPESLPVRLARPFGEEGPGNLLGRTYALLPASAVLWLAGAAFDRDGLRDAGLGCMASNVAGTLTRVTFSYIVGRSRPSITDDPHAFEMLPFRDWEKHSLPSGHSLNIMSCVSFWTHRFQLGFAEPIMFAVAGLVALGRTVDREHWPSDTLVGMSWGFAIGKAVAGESRKRENSREGRPRLLPYVAFTLRF